LVTERHVLFVPQLLPPQTHHRYRPILIVNLQTFLLAAWQQPTSFSASTPDFVNDRYKLVIIERIYRVQLLAIEHNSSYTFENSGLRLLTWRIECQTESTTLRISLRPPHLHPLMKKHSRIRKFQGDQFVEFQSPLSASATESLMRRLEMRCKEHHSNQIWDREIYGSLCVL
jgi:hypothetical protein